MTRPAEYVTPGHPVKDGAGYDCGCGECLYQRAMRMNLESVGIPEMYWAKIIEATR